MSQFIQVIKLCINLFLLWNVKGDILRNVPVFSYPNSSKSNLKCPKVYTCFYTTKCDITTHMQNIMVYNYVNCLLFYKLSWAHKTDGQESTHGVLSGSYNSISTWDVWNVAMMWEYFIAFVYGDNDDHLVSSCVSKLQHMSNSAIITQTMGENEPGHVCRYSHALTNMDPCPPLSNGLLECLPTSLLTWCHLLTMTDFQLLVSPLCTCRNVPTWFDPTTPASDLRGGRTERRLTHERFEGLKSIEKLWRAGFCSEHICCQHSSSIMAAGTRTHCPPLSSN